MSIVRSMGKDNVGGAHITEFCSATEKNKTTSFKRKLMELEIIMLHVK